MATPHKSVSVPEYERKEFDLSLAGILAHLDMSYSEFSREVVLRSVVLQKNELSSYMSRESRKADDYKYLVLATKV